MKMLLAALALILPASVALAESYGIPAACAYNNGDESAVWTGDDPNYFDGKVIGGGSWDCNISGHCYGEDNTWKSKITVSLTDTIATLTIDGATFTLPRCPEVPAS